MSDIFGCKTSKLDVHNFDFEKLQKFDLVSFTKLLNQDVSQFRRAKQVIVKVERSTQRFCLYNT